MLKPRILLLLFFLLLTFTWLFSASRWQRTAAAYLPNHSTILKGRESVSKIKEKAGEAGSYARQNAFNQKICFLADMSLSSGQNRFFVYDLDKDSVINSGLVTHGRCNQDWLEGRKYGNTPGCGCTSLGKYRIGFPYQGRFGLAFKLYGLDKTNDKAFQRFVVLHAHACVPSAEVKEDICQSDGCPTVAPAFLQQLKGIIGASKKPVLLWIYE